MGSIPDLPEEYERIDHYWKSILSMKVDDGKIKNKCLPDLVKIALVLPHRNADVERRLSVNTMLLQKIDQQSNW